MKKTNKKTHHIHVLEIKLYNRIMINDYSSLDPLKIYEPI